MGQSPLGFGFGVTFVGLAPCSEPVLQSLERTASSIVAVIRMSNSSKVQNPQSKVVFVHGAGSSADFWHRQRTAFPDAHYLELPGHAKQSEEGRSVVGDRS